MGGGATEGRRGWLNRTVAAFGLTSLLSDAGHEMATSVLPLQLARLGLGATALGAVEGIADAAAYWPAGISWVSA